MSNAKKLSNTNDARIEYAQQNCTRLLRDTQTLPTAYGREEARTKLAQWQDTLAFLLNIKNNYILIEKVAQIVEKKPEGKPFKINLCTLVSTETARRWSETITESQIIFNSSKKSNGKRTVVTVSKLHAEAYNLRDFMFRNRRRYDYEFDNAHSMLIITKKSGRIVKNTAPETDQDDMLMNIFGSKFTKNIK